MSNELMDENDKLLRKKEAAKMLACCERTVDRMAASGELTKIKVRGAKRFRLSQILSMVKGNA